MKIVHLVIGGDVAGGQLVALQLARAARDAGHDVSFVAPTPGAFLELVEADGFAADVVPIRGALDFAAVHRLRRVLRAQDASLLHTHAHFSVNVVGRVAGRLAGVPVIAHVHVENAFSNDAARRRLQIALDNATARLAWRLVAVSDATRDAVVRQGYPAARTITIRNGIDPVVDVAPAVLDTPSGTPVLVEVGRLCEVKGQRELIQALARLRRDDATLVLVGEDIEAGGAYRDGLARDADALGVTDRVRFLGYRDDVAAIVAAADVSVLPSSVEGLPLVVLEAMVQGKPVVATAVGGTPELVSDGETGLLVPPRDVDALVRALDGLLDDPERARRLGEHARERVLREFSAADATARVLRLYAEAAN